MELAERQKWVLSVLNARGGTVDKHQLIGLMLGKLGISRSFCYDIINGLIGLDAVREIHVNRKDVLVLVREGP